MRGIPRSWFNRRQRLLFPKAAVPAEGCQTERPDRLLDPLKQLNDILPINNAFPPRVTQPRQFLFLLNTQDQPGTSRWREAMLVWPCR
jgi:hypothetical protein